MRRLKKKVKPGMICANTKVTAAMLANGIRVPCIVGANVYPYMGIVYDRRVSFGKGKKFRVCIYQAYNAYGLIGSEYNGIVVFDESKMQVLCDEISREPTGYFGASAHQVQSAEQLVNTDWETFRATINTHKNHRYEI